MLIYISQIVNSILLFPCLNNTLLIFYNIIREVFYETFTINCLELGNKVKKYQQVINTKKRKKREKFQFRYKNLCIISGCYVTMLYVIQYIQIEIYKDRLLMIRNIEQH